MITLISKKPPAKAKPGTQILFLDGGVPKFRDEKGRDSYAANVVEGTPVAAVAATGTTAMTGDNNDWDATAVTKGTIGNSRSLTVAIEAGKYTDPTVAIAAGGAVTITAGNKARMSVDGITADGNGDPVSGPTEHIYVSMFNSKPDYTDTGSGGVDWDGTNWAITIASVLSFTSTDDVATPDLVTTWTPVGSATGTPVVTALNHTAAQCKTAFDATVANENLFTLTNKSGNDGTGAVAAQATVTLSGGVDGTVATKGSEMFDDTNVYLAITNTTTSDSSGWRKVAHSAL